MIAKLRKFAQLSGQDKRLFVEAYTRLGIMRAAIATLSFKRLTHKLEKLNDDASPVIDDDQLVAALAIGRAVRSAANHTPWQSACLVQVLTAQRMLQKRGIGGVIYIGANLNKHDREPFGAHAWLMCYNNFVTGEAGHDQYIQLAAFSWDGDNNNN
jgi:hypothetical protein